MASKAAVELALAKCASSGLSPQDVKALGFEVLDGPEMPGVAKNFPEAPALCIPYLNPFDKNRPLRAAPRWPAMRRYRYLQSVGDPKKPLRYVQESGTGSCAYFPPLVDWKAIAEDPSIGILITEGELKAACATKHGFPTIGLGGVWCFSSVQSRCTFLPELEQVEWARRAVTLVFDSDVTTNEKVADALNTLADELRNRGAFPSLVVLPSVEGLDKVGLDDYLVHEGPDRLEKLLAAPMDLTLAKPLWKMNSELIYIASPCCVVNQRTSALHTTKDVAGSLFTKDCAELKVKAGEISLAKVHRGKAWLEWPFRNSVDAMTYTPGREQVYTEESTSYFNSWRGWATEPVKGDVSLYLKLVDHLFSTTTKEAKEWFLRWCAYPIQNPGAKLYSAVAIHGANTGTGKSFLFYCLGRIYGTNFSEIREADLHSSFNSWSKDKQFVLGDDVTGSDKRAYADMLKAMVTQKELRVNIKYVPSYTVPDCVNYAFTSNQPDAFFLEDDDRRFFIHEVTVNPLPQAFYVKLEKWLETEEGGNALHHYLLNLPMGDFDHRSRAMETAAKQAMVAIGRSDLAVWCDQLKHAPELVLKHGEAPIAGDLFTAKDLLTLYDPYGNHKVSANGLAKAMKRARFMLACGGDPVRWAHGQDRFWIVRNLDKWLQATPSAVRAHAERRKG